MADNFFKIKSGANLNPSSTTPTSPINGDVYYDNTLNKLSGYENGVFVTAGGGSVGQDSIDAMYKEFAVTTGNKVFSISNLLNPLLLKNVWVSSGNLITGREENGSVGTQNAALTMGGYAGANTSTSELFNGAQWSSTGNLSQAKLGGYGSGIQNAGLQVGGFNVGVLSSCETFNGATWSSTGTLNVGRFEPGCAGTRNSMLAAAGSLLGYGGPYSNTAETFNGATWSNVSATLATTAYNPSWAGIAGAALIVHGSDNTSNNYPNNNVQKFNGSVFITVASRNSPGTGPAGAGTQNAAISMGGFTSAPANVNLCEMFNGSTWYYIASLPSVRSFCGGLGTAAAAMQMGGAPGVANTTYKYFGEVPFDYNMTFKGVSSQIAAKNTPISTSDVGILMIDIAPKANSGLEAGEILDLIRLGRLHKYDGKWTASGAMNTARNATPVAGIQKAAVAAGGFTGSAGLLTSELYNGATWANVSGGNLNAKHWQAVCHGLANAALVATGYNDDGGTTLGATSEKFNGATWANVSGGNVNTSRAEVSNTGVQGAGIMTGGYDTSAIIATSEKFNGSVWSAVSGGNLLAPRSRATCFGTQNATIVASGYTTGSTLVTTSEKFNGSVWSAAGAVNLARFESGGCGTMNNGIMIGGADGASNSSVTTERYNGSNWSYTGNTNTARNPNANGAGTGSTAMSTGGRLLPSGTTTAITENFSTEITLPYSGAIIGRLNTQG